MTTDRDRFVAALDELELPDADLVQAVLADVAGARAQPAWRPLAPRLGLAFGVVLLCLAAVLLLVEPARSAVADWLGIGATKVEVVPPTAPTGDSSDEPLEPSAEALGEPSRAAVDPIPRLGPPAGVFDGPVARGRSYTWPADEAHPGLGGTGVGLVLSVRSTEGELDAKRVAGDTGVEIVTIEYEGAPTTALWIDGAHELVAAGATRPVLAERVLLWEADGVQFRLELDGGLAAVRPIAAAVRGGTDLLQPG